jgi:hypothetical protein
MRSNLILSLLFDPQLCAPMSDVKTLGAGVRCRGGCISQIANVPLPAFGLSGTSNAARVASSSSRVLPLLT